jgi:hypothetical protein
VRGIGHRGQSFGDLGIPALGGMLVAQCSAGCRTRIWLSGLAAFSILSGAVFAFIPWRLLWLYSSPCVVDTHG